MKVVITDINLLFIRYVKFDYNGYIHKWLFFQWPWSRLKNKIGKYQKVSDFY